MAACSRAWMAANTAFGAALLCAEHSLSVASGVSRGSNSAGAVGKAALTAASTLAGSTACCAMADVPRSEASARTISRMAVTPLSALDGRCGNLAALRVPGEIRDERDADVGSELELGHAH